MSTIQSNHSLQFVTPVISRFVDDLLVKILSAGAHSVIEIVQAGNRSVIDSSAQPFIIIIIIIIFVYSFIYDVTGRMP